MNHRRPLIALLGSLLGSLVVLASCTSRSTIDTTTAPTTVTTGTTGTVIDGTIETADGRTRTYHLSVPSALPPGPRPLLIALHGGTGWGTQFQRTSGFDDLAAANGLLVVYPDGIGVGADGTKLRTWNAGYCCGPAARQDVDDVGFIRLLIDTIAGQFDVDESRVFAAGHSNGGMLSYRLACELSDRVVAIGVQSGSLGVEPCTPAQPVSVLHIHGTADTNHPIEGGTGSTSISGVDYHSARYSVQTVATAIGCSGAPADSATPLDPAATVTTWADCPAGVDVQLLAVAGASHAWMGHPAANPAAVGVPYQGLDSSAVLLEFLMAHPRP